MDQLNKDVDFGLRGVDSIIKPYETSIYGDLEQEYNSLSFYTNQSMVRKENDLDHKQSSYLYSSMKLSSSKKQKALVM